MNINIIIIVLLIILLYLSIPNNNYLEHFGSNWDENIDGIIYINLENRDDRKELVFSELKKINTNMAKVNKVSGIYIPKNGHKGCVQSHILALTIAKINKWKNVLILEDDFELVTNPINFNNKINYIFDYLKDNQTEWNVIMLATAYAEKINIDDTIVKIKMATTGSAYIVNNTYYDTLLNIYTNSNDNMTNDKWTDGDAEPYALDQQWLPHQENGNWFGFTTDLIKQRNIRSTTNERI